MADIEDFECSIELPIGIKFLFWNHLYEVAESKEGDFCCSKCAFSEEDICGVMNCGRRHRHDGKCAYFNEVKQSKEE